MTPSNEPPEIPSLKPSGDKEEKKGTGLAPSSAAKPSSGFKFPGFGTAGKGGSAPSLRVRGLPGGSTVMDRLKNLRKKDLIFIAAGLCTLGMAPLAEHLLMAPEDSAGQLKEGFSTQGPLFADGSTVYESGSGVGSPGALIGQGTDVITPLNVRDPSNLVMSPGATKKQDAVVTPPPPPPSGGGKAEPDWRDVLKDSAKGAASAAVKSAGKLPKPNVKMAGAIRGLSALGGGGGGTGASLKLDPLKAEHAPNRAAGSNALSRVQATPGFRGATSRSPASSGAGEALRAAGSRQADIFNRGGGAAGALDAASREAIPTGGAGNFGGRPGQGDETKNPGGNNSKDAKQLGESLAFLRQKMEMDKSIDLKWKKKEWNEFGRQKSMEEAAIKMGFDMFGKFTEKAFIDPITGLIGQAIQGSDGPQVGWECTFSDGTVKKYSNGQLAKAGWKVVNGDLVSNGSQGGGSGRLGTCKAAVVGADDGGTPTPSPDRPPSSVKGPTRDRISQGTGASMQGAWDRYCAPNAPESLTGPGGAQSDTCKQLQLLKTTVDNTLPTIEKNNDDAIQFIRQGYDKLKTAHSHLDKAVSSLGSATGDADGKAGKDGAPFLAIQNNFQSAQQNLSGGKNTEAKGDLEKAKTEGYEKAVGQGGSPSKLAAGAALADAAGMEQPALAASDAAKADFDSAAAQVKAGHAAADKTLADIQGMQPPAEPAGVPVIQRVRGEIGQTLTKLKTELTKTGGANGDDGGYNKAAIDVRAAQVERLREDVYGPQKARDAVFGAATKAETTLGALQGWVMPNPAATPPETEQTAAAKNLQSVQPALGEFITEAGTARTKVVPLGPESKEVLQKVDGCIKAFDSGTPSC